MSRRALELELQSMLQVRECRLCGCTDDNACVGADGLPCHWVAADLCSACAEDLAVGQQPAVPAGYIERPSGLAVPEGYA